MTPCLPPARLNSPGRHAMFEDSTFESTGRIKTRSRRWMLAALFLNGSILVALVLIPLIYPDALPSHFIPMLLVAPPSLQPETQPQPVRVRPATAHDFSELDNGRITAPPNIPTSIRYVDRGDRPFAGPNIAIDSGSGFPGGDSSPFGKGQPVTVLHPPSPSNVRLPSRLVESTVIYKTIPQYPIIAKTAAALGTVVLQSTISKAGPIVHLQLNIGPHILH